MNYPITSKVYFGATYHFVIPLLGRNKIFTKSPEKNSLEQQ